MAIWAGLPGPALAQNASLDTPASAVPGSEFRVTRQGPDAAGEPADYVTIVEAGAPGTAFGPYARLKGSTQVVLQAPAAAGDYEILYVSNDGAVLGRRGLEVR